MTQPNGYILYEGPSALDGAPIVVIATGFASASANGKTGDMIQTWIIRADVAPHHAVKTGDDVSICGQCPHRPAMRADMLASGQTFVPCYVKTFQAPLSVFNGYQRGTTRAHYWPYLEHMQPGDVVAIPFAGFDPVILSRNITAACCHAWGNQQAISQRDDIGRVINVLRIG